jgi:hypothetical protein
VQFFNQLSTKQYGITSDEGVVTADKNLYRILDEKTKGKRRLDKHRMDGKLKIQIVLKNNFAKIRLREVPLHWSNLINALANELANSNIAEFQGHCLLDLSLSVW